MKKILLVALLAIATFFIYSFAISGKSHDPKLIGNWKGFEKDKQIDGVEKHWIQERFKDGTYVIMFTSIQNCEVETFIEKGTWWTENGKFYEKSNEGKDIDVYNYEVVDNLVVKFKSIKLLGEDNADYIFEDYRIE